MAIRRLYKHSKHLSVFSLFYTPWETTALTGEYRMHNIKKTL